MDFVQYGIEYEASSQITTEMAAIIIATEIQLCTSVLHSW